tara:strand:- start:392 stop:961 length:570 start_codon:yes stop_codon:yes gene_type:complete
MGGFAQRIGKKVKAGVRAGLKVGAVAGAVGLGYLGYKGSQDIKDKGVGAVEDVGNILNEGTAELTQIAKQVGVKSLITGNTQGAIALATEKAQIKTLIAKDKVSNPDLPSTAQISQNQAKQQANIIDDRSKRQAEKIRRIAMKRRADLQMRTRGGGGQGDMLTASKSADCVKKHGTNIKSRRYLRCMNK